MLKKEPLSGKGREQVGDMMTSMKELSSLVDLLLNISRLNAGKISIKPEPVELVSWVKSLIDECAPICDEKNLKISFHHSA